MEIALPSYGEALRYYAQLAHGTIARGYVCWTVDRPRGPIAWTVFGFEPELEGGSDRSRALRSTCHGDILENPPVTIAEAPPVSAVVCWLAPGTFDAYLCGRIGFASLHSQLFILRSILSADQFRAALGGGGSKYYPLSYISYNLKTAHDNGNKLSVPTYPTSI